MAGFVVVGPVAVLKTLDGSERYLYRGAPVGDAFTEDALEHALELGLIALVPSIEDLDAQAALARELKEAEAAVEFDDRVTAAVERKLADATAEFDDRVNAAVVKKIAERDAEAAAEAERLAKEQANGTPPAGKPATTGKPPANK